jgi:hypothetical protein
MIQLNRNQWDEDRIIALFHGHATGIVFHGIHMMDIHFTAGLGARTFWNKGCYRNSYGNNKGNNGKCLLHLRGDITGNLYWTPISFFYMIPHRFYKILVCYHRPILLLF